MAAQRKAQRKTSTRKASTRRTSTSAPTKVANLQKEFLDTAEARLKTLKPLVDEYHGLEQAVQAVKSAGSSAAASGGASSPRATSQRRPGRPKGSSNKSAGTGRGRPKGTGKRAQQVIAEVEKAGDAGLTVPQLADKLGMKAPYLYKVAPDLVKQRKLKKDGKLYKPVSS